MAIEQQEAVHEFFECWEFKMLRGEPKDPNILFAAAKKLSEYALVDRQQILIDLARIDRCGWLVRKAVSNIINSIAREEKAQA